MKNLTLENITKVCNGIYHGPQEKLQEEVTAITTDSRKVEKVGLFVPVVGERVDAHRFIPQVMEAGALATLSERVLEGADHPYIQVESSLQAVKDIAEFYLEQLEIPVVGITGSVGKTSTKEVIASVLKEGISDFGEMTRLAKIAKPDTCVITNIGTCHLENLGDRDGVLKAKTEIFKYVKKNIVLNGDDDKLSTVKEYNGIQPVFFGNGENASVTCENVESRGLKGMSCDICLKGKMAENGEFQKFHVEIPMPGRHMVSNALAAAAIGRLYGLNAEQIKNGIESLEPVSGRFNMIETDKFMIVDDCYNANPMSMKASLDVLQDGLGRRVAILGDMGELGTDEVALHEGVGVHAGHCKIDACICVGPLAAHIAKKASETNPDLTVIQENNLESLLKNLSTYVKQGDTILVKASHFMKFENVVKALQEM